MSIKNQKMPKDNKRITLIRYQTKEVIIITLVIWITIAFIFTKIPIVGKYISVINTLIHESGHALASLLTSGRVYSIKLFANTGGLVTTGSTNWFSRVIVALFGYVSSSLSSYLFFYFIVNERSSYILYFLMVLILVNLFLWIRNVYGIFWLTTFFLVIVLLLKTDTIMENYFIYFIASIVLVQSIETAFTIFKLSIKNKKEAGDATNLAKLTFIPASVWGLFFFVQSLYFGYLVVNLYF